MKNTTFRKVAKINNFFVYHFNKINDFIKITNHKFKNISSFNRYLIFLITLLFLYLFFLSIPSLYDKGALQSKINTMINEEYNINLSLSSKIDYKILPKPHFTIENTKLYTNDSSSPNELAQIKKLKVFINQANFFKKNSIELTKISLVDVNFLIDNENLKYLKNYLQKKFSTKNLNIINSKFFYMDDEGNVISIFPVSKLTFNYNKKNLENILISKGSIYNIPFNISWKNDFKNKLNKTILKLNKLNLRVENFTYKEKSNLSIKNFIFFRSSEIETEIEIEEDSIKLKSIGDSKIKNNKLNYTGEISKNPFHFNMNLNLDKLDFKKNIFDNNFLQNLFELKYLYNENLSSNINLKVHNIIKNKFFDSSRIFINFSNGGINFNNTIFNGKVGNLNLIYGNIENIKDDLIFNGSFVFNVVSKDEFYRFFQVGKKSRKKIEIIYFNLKFNLTKNKIKISNLLFEPGKIILENELSDFLEQYDQGSKIDNWIDFKNFVRKVFVNYYEG